MFNVVTLMSLRCEFVRLNKSEMSDWRRRVEKQVDVDVVERQIGDGEMDRMMKVRDMLQQVSQSL